METERQKVSSSATVLCYGIWFVDSTKKSLRWSRQIRKIKGNSYRDLNNAQRKGVKEKVWGI